MKRCVATGLAAASLIAPPAADAAGSAGGSFTASPAQTNVGLRVKNLSDATTLTQVDFTLPGGTTIDGTPSGGGQCSTANPQQGTCSFARPRESGEEVYVFVNTDGPAPSAIDVTVHFGDASTIGLTAQA